MTTRASLYRTLNRLQRSDVHHVTEHIRGPEAIEQAGEQEAPPPSPDQDWSGRRRAKPAEELLPTTVRWLEALPPNVQPKATSDTYPRIANTLALLWRRPDALTEYLDELLIDKRGGRRGFPVAVLEELHALSGYYAMLRSPSESR